MKQFKEKPALDHAKEKPKPALLPRQAAHMMKEKYIKELDQRPKGAEGDTQQAPDQVEHAGRWAVDELSGRAVGQGKEYAKKKFAAARGETRAGDGPPVEGAPGGQSAPEHPAAAPMEHREIERSPTAPKERPQAEHTANPIKDRQTAEHRAAGQERPKPHHTAKTTPGGHPHTYEGVHPLKERHGAQALKERPQFSLRRREGSMPASASAPGRGPASGGKAPRSAKAALTPKVRRGVVKAPARPATRSAAPAARAAKAAHRKMQRRIFNRAAKPMKNIGAILRRALQAVTKAAAALTGAVSAIVGGCVLLVALVIVIVIAAVANSPFGLFFAHGSSTSGAVSVAQAVGSVNVAYNARLELLQAGDYDRIDIQGAAPDWPDVLAVFAAKVAGTNADGVDVATLDSDRVAKLTAVFWDMCTLSSSLETILHADSDPDDDVDDSWTEKALHVIITSKTADDMRTAYAFTSYQNSALDELLADRTALASLAGSLSITSADVLAVLRALPDDLAPERRAVVEKVLSLVGKVNYFWGGKSYVIGWDSRWGTLQKVTSPGSDTTGTCRPYGLDCSGFLDWALRNAGLHSDGNWYIGRNLTAVSQADAIPGDFALYPDVSHVGMIVGRNAAGELLVCHCASGQNNVVVTEFSVSGFTDVGRQVLVPR